MLRAIQTEYKGYKFRSRLEARWAVFFDSIGLEWRYEMQGFDLNGIWYLPDFYIRDVPWTKVDQPRSMFVEIKPKFPSETEMIKARLLALMSNKPCLMLYGECYPEEGNGLLFHPEFEQSRYKASDEIQREESQFRWWFEDSDDGVVLSFMRWMMHKSMYGGSPAIPDKVESLFVGAINPPTDLRKYYVDIFAANNPLVMHAATAARSARFEHGETPQ